MKYGEILFLGGCNCNCYYCLKHEMKKLKKEKENQMKTDYKNWENFDKFLDICRIEKIEKIYLSSVSSEPMLYKYLYELILKIKKEGFKVGIRSNGYFTLNKIEAIYECDEEISFSINSFNDSTNYKIAKVKYIPDWEELFNKLIDNHKKCRISIVVNRYNKKEIKEMIDYLSNFSCIEYVQLRKIYKYKRRSLLDCLAFNRVVKWLKKNALYTGNYFESPIYNYKNLKISIWSDVFKKESIQSINYFTNGVISTANLLIPAYERKEGVING